MGKKEEMLECLKNITIAGAPLVLTPVGAALLSLANECFNSTAQTRQDKWNEEIVTKISELSEDFEEKFNMCSNFASILATAQRGALEDIEEDKVGLYANAVINSIKNEDIDNTKTHIFLNMLRDFTKLHIEVLQELALLDNGIHPNLRHGRDSYIKQRIREKNPQLIEDIGMFRLTALELQQKGLCVVTVIDMADNSDYDNVITTSLGQEFLQFISEQEKAND